MTSYTNNQPIWYVYTGYAVVYDEGRRMYSKTSGIQRLSRGDAMRDAAWEAHDLHVTRFFNESNSQKPR